GGDARERRERLARVRRDLKLDRLEAAGGGCVERLERDLEAPAAHREALHRLRDAGPESLRRRAARRRELARRGAICALARALLLLELFEGLLAAQLRQARAPLFERRGDRGGLDAVLARVIHHGLDALVELGEPARIELELLEVAAQ